MSKRSSEDAFFAEYEKRKKKPGYVDIYAQKIKPPNPNSLPEVFGFIIGNKQFDKKDGTKSKMKTVDIIVCDVGTSIQLARKRDDKNKENLLSKFIFDDKLILPILNKVKKEDVNYSNSEKSFKERLDFYSKTDNLIMNGNIINFISVPLLKVSENIKIGDLVIIKNLVCNNGDKNPTAYFTNADSVELVTQGNILKKRFECALQIYNKFDKNIIEKLSFTNDDFKKIFVLPSQTVTNWWLSDLPLQKRITPCTLEEYHGLIDLNGSKTDVSNWIQKVSYRFEVFDIFDKTNPDLFKYKKYDLNFGLYEQECLLRGFPTPIIAENILMTHDIPTIYICRPYIKKIKKKFGESWDISDEIFEINVINGKAQFDDKVMNNMNYRYELSVLTSCSRFNEYLFKYGFELNIGLAIEYLIKTCVEDPDDHSEFIDDYVSLKKEFIMKSDIKDNCYLNKFEDKDCVLLNTFTNKSITRFFNENWSLRLLVGGKNQTIKNIKKQCFDSNDVISINDVIELDRNNYSSLLYAVKNETESDPEKDSE